MHKIVGGLVFIGLRINKLLKKISPDSIHKNHVDSYHWKNFQNETRLLRSGELVYLRVENFESYSVNRTLVTWSRFILVKAYFTKYESFSLSQPNSINQNVGAWDNEKHEMSPSNSKIKIWTNTHYTVGLSVWKTSGRNCYITINSRTYDTIC